MSANALAIQSEEGPAWFLDALAIPVKSHYVTSDGATVHYTSWNASDLLKPPLLFVHGFLGHTHWWDFIAPYFTAHFRVFALDFSGMGDSDHRPTYTAEAWRDEIAAVLRDINGGPAVVVAHSFGGARSVEAASAYPELITHLVVIDSYLHFADHAPRGDRFGNAQQERRYADRATAMAHYRLIPPQDAPSYIIEHLAGYSILRKGNAWGWKFDELNMMSPRDEPDSTEMLSRLAVPLSLIHGEHSRIATRARMERVARLVPKCVGLVEIPQAHHHVMIDQPLALVSCLRALFSKSA